MADLSSERGSQGGGVKLSKTDLLARYRERIKMTKRFRDHEKLEETWTLLCDMYKGKHFRDLSDEDRIVVNIAFATVNVIAPAVAVNHPKITVWAKDQEGDSKAVITEAVVNYWWKHYDFKPHFRKAVKDYLIYGFGWLKVGYRYEERPIPLTDAEFLNQFFSAKAQADDYAQANPQDAHLLPTDEEIRAGLDTHKMYTVSDQPFVERCSPYDVYVDPEATCEEDMLWIAQRITRTLEEVKKDKRYPYAVRKNLAASGQVSDDLLDPSRHKKKYGDDIDRVVLWEFYDIERGTLSVFTDAGDRFLVDPIPMPYTFGIPFVMLRNYDVPEDFYPMGDLEAIVPLQEELNDTRSGMVAARNQDVPKTMYRRSMAADTLAALRSKTRGELVPIDDDQPFDMLMAPVPSPTANPMLFQHSEVVEKDVDRISGVNEYMRGGVPETRRTATEATIIQDAANSRAADKLETIESVIGQVARRVVALAQQYMTGQQVARVVGTNAQQVWVPFSRRDIEGEYDFSVEGGSTQPMNESFRRQQATQVLTAMQPFLESGLINVPALLQYTLQYGFGITNPGRFISQQAPVDHGPDKKLIETLGYKDAPPDIQRQIEAQAGFKPSELGSAPNPAGAQGPAAQPKGPTNPKKPKDNSGNDPASLGAQASQRLNKQ